MWERVDYKKVQAEIRNVIQALKQSDNMDAAEWKQVLEERAQSLIIRSRSPIILACHSCGGPFIFDEMNPELYTSEGLRFPNECPSCMEDHPPHQ